MSKNIILAAVLLCAGAHGAYADEAIVGIDTVLRRVAGHNADVKAARSDYDAAHQGVAVAESAKLPTLSASLTLNYLGDGTILDRDFANAMRDKLPHFGNALNLNLYQPLYTGGAISAAIDMARQKTEMASIGIDRQTDISGIEALARYFNMLKMHNLKRVYAENIALTRRLIDDMTVKHAQGTALKNDVTRYELRLSSLAYDSISIDNSISVLNLDLATMLGYDDDTSIVPAEPAGDQPIMPESWWLDEARASSLDLRTIDQSARIAHTALRLERAGRMPTIGLIIGDQLSGPVTFEIPAINKNYNAWYAGITVKYDISSLWTVNKKEKQRRLEIAHLQDRRYAAEDALERSVHQAYTALMQAGQMLETQTLNVKLANENYAVVQTRFDNDMALLTDMLDASTAKLDAETRLVNARIDFLMSYYNLKFICGILNK